MTFAKGTVELERNSAVELIKKNSGGRGEERNKRVWSKGPEA